MVPKLHSKGTSFRGVGLYVLHDKDGAESSDRVEWTDVRNLATDDPQIAWRVMAATAMNADRLKAEAGVKRTGRKSKDVVQHMTLSWHPDEAEGLTREEMMRAAHGAIKALGAEDRQALIVSHSDEEQPHVHVVINRVSPEDGRLLPSSKEKLNLSKWAQGYEEERGQIYCDERVINNAARDRGEYTRGKKDTPRHIYEQMAGNDNRPGLDAIRKQQRARDREIGKRQRKLKSAQKTAWAKLENDHKAHIAKLGERKKRNIEAARQKVREAYRDRWKQQHHEHQAKRRVFEKNEKTLLGRAKNRMSAADLKGAVRGERKGRSASVEFDARSSAGARLEQFNATQKKRDQALERKQRAAENRAEWVERQKAGLDLGRARVEFLASRAGLVFTQSLERAKVRAEWNTRSQERGRAFERARASEPETEPRGKQTTSLDPQIQKYLDEHRAQMREVERRRGSEKDQERGRDD